MVESHSVRPPSRVRRANADRPVDLRSDTVTRPSKQMRAAMAAAEVGDDVLDGDPTTRELEDRVAQLLGAQGAVWTPTGSMGNIIALMSHVGRGEAFLAPAGSHVLDDELGAGAWLAGGTPRPLDHDAGPGRISPSAIRRAVGVGGPGSAYALRTTLLCLENTHNSAGGVVTPPEQHAAVVAAARGAKLAVHLDGARLWHAAVTLGVPPGALTVGVDTVQVCLSKGLGAPAGALVAGSLEFVGQARRLRKMLGGGMRQNGVLAAAGLVALDQVDRLAEDHERARVLAAGLRERGWQAATPETNIVLITVADLAGTLARFEQAGVKVAPIGGKVRLVTHADLTDADIKTALARIGEIDQGRPVGQPVLPAGQFTGAPGGLPRR